jgi:hypothetical protein
MAPVFRRIRSSARAANQACIRALAAQAPSDLEALAQLFEAEGIVDDGTVAGRLRALLDATGRRTIPGLQTAIPFGDTGFTGDRRRGGAGFRDPWPASRNQVGHFLTAAGLSFAPELVARRIPLLGSIRTIVRAPETMSDAEVALRLSIGHEKVQDPPNTLEAALLALAEGFVEARRVVGMDLTTRERMRRIALAVVAEAARQTWGSMTRFREQFQATTDRDMAAWRAALRPAAADRREPRRGEQRAGLAADPSGVAARPAHRPGSVPRPTRRGALDQGRVRVAKSNKARGRRCSPSASHERVYFAVGRRYCTVIVAALLSHA